MSTPELPEVQSATTFEASTAWRLMILLSPGETLGFAGKLGDDLTRTHQGELLIASLIPEGSESARQEAHITLRRAAEEARLCKITITNLVTIEYDKQQEATQLGRFIHLASIDFMLKRADKHTNFSSAKLPCDVGILRGTLDHLDQQPDLCKLDNILVPSAGGPNTIAAFEALGPLTRETEITALYVADEELGQRERAHGQGLLSQALKVADVNEDVKSVVISAANPIAGIAGEAAKEQYDLVIVGANEDSLDLVIFGDVVGSVIRDAGKPVMIMRRRRTFADGFVDQVDWRLRQLVPHLDRKQRNETYARIRQSSRPEISFFVLITLASAIAGFGLLQNSPAVVIGAMLVAPLMSPIVGLGMAMVLGDVRFIRLSLGAIARGVGLAILVGVLVGLFNIGNDLPQEVANRTQPGLLDLGVALFSGLAAAYALCYSQAAGALPGVAIAAALVPPLASVGIAFVNGKYPESLGALLLFGTNFITISSASAFVFFLLGFRPTTSEKQRLEIRLRTARWAIILLIVNALILGYATVNLIGDASRTNAIEDAVEHSVEITEEERKEVIYDYKLELDSAIVGSDSEDETLNLKGHRSVISHRLPQPC